MKRLILVIAMLVTAVCISAQNTTVESYEKARPVLDRAGVHACPNRVAAVYLELAVLVRALEGLADAARLDSTPDRSSLWAGLFDLRDTLLGSTVDDLRALAA